MDSFCPWYQYLLLKFINFLEKKVALFDPYDKNAELCKSLH